MPNVIRLSMFKMWTLKQVWTNWLSFSFDCSSFIEITCSGPPVGSMAFSFLSPTLKSRFLMISEHWWRRLWVSTFKLSKSAPSPSMAEKKVNQNQTAEIGGCHDIWHAHVGKNRLICCEGKPLHHTASSWNSRFEISCETRIALSQPTHWESPPLAVWSAHPYYGPGWCSHPCPLKAVLIAKNAVKCSKCFYCSLCILWSDLPPRAIVWFQIGSSRFFSIVCLMICLIHLVLLDLNLVYSFPPAGPRKSKDGGRRPWNTLIRLDKLDNVTCQLVSRQRLEK